MTRLSVYIATSVDGYIATVDGGLDWLETASNPTEDYGFDAFLASVDALAMGRGTYDHIAHLDPLPFGQRPVFVFTSRPAPALDGVTFVSESPEAALLRWTESGLQHVYVDGGRVVSDFLEAGLIDELILFTMPVLLGDGRPLFHPVGVGAELELVDVQAWPSGVTRRTYVRR